MDKKEFIKRALEAGCDEEFIAESLQLHDDAKQEGIKLPYKSILLPGKITNYPAGPQK